MEENVKDNVEIDKDINEFDLAKEANKALNEKDKRILELQKQLAKERLYSKAPVEEKKEVSMSDADCLKIINTPNISNYDYASAVLNLHNNALREGKKSPLGEKGVEVAKLFSDVIEKCDGDKSKFMLNYQLMIGDDELEAEVAYENAIKNKK